MANNKVQKLITISKMGSKDNKFWIKDTDGEFYSGFKEYNGTTNQEWNLVQHGKHGEPFQEGDQALIEFTKTAGTDKEGKDVIYKNIRGIYPAETTATPSKVEKARGEAPMRSQGPSNLVKDDAFWERQAYEKCCSLWAAAAIESGVEFTQIDDRIKQGTFWKLFQAIKADGAKRFSSAVKPTNLENELPTIEVGEDLSSDVSGIPF